MNVKCALNTKKCLSNRDTKMQRSLFLLKNSAWTVCGSQRVILKSLRLDFFFT